MNDQILTQIPTICDFHIASPEALAEEPVSASSRDYGFDLDQDEIGRELLAPLPRELSSQTMTQVDMEDFEASHLWFLS